MSFFLYWHGFRTGSFVICTYFSCQIQRSESHYPWAYFSCQIQCSESHYRMNAMDTFFDLIRIWKLIFCQFEILLVSIEAVCSTRIRDLGSRSTVDVLFLLLVWHFASAAIDVANTWDAFESFDIWRKRETLLQTVLVHQLQDVSFRYVTSLHAQMGGVTLTIASKLQIRPTRQRKNIVVDSVGKSVYELQLRQQRWRFGQYARLGSDLHQANDIASAVVQVTACLFLLNNGERR